LQRELWLSIDVVLCGGFGPLSLDIPLWVGRISTRVLAMLLATCMLLISQMCTNFGNWDFSAAGPRVWNYLPTDLRKPDFVNYSRFRQMLKAFLFGQWDQNTV